MRLLLAALALTPGAAFAAPQAPAPCTVAAPLPPGFEAMAHRTPLAADAALIAGAAVDVTLGPIADIRFATPPAKPGKPGSFGGIIPVAITKAGTYRFALSEGAWIDLIRDGKAIASTAHDHGPACSGVRKIVDFSLSPGRYTLQVAGSAKPVIAVVIVAP